MSAPQTYPRCHHELMVLRQVVRTRAGMLQAEFSCSHCGGTTFVTTAPSSPAPRPSLDRCAMALRELEAAGC